VPEKPRRRFAKFTGGLNSAFEPHLIPEDAYSVGNNVALKNGIVRSRDGSEKSIAYDDKCKGMGEYLFIDKDGVIFRYLLWVEGGDLRLAAWDSGTSAYIEHTVSDVATPIYTGLDADAFASIENFNGKVIVSNGVDPPLEFDREFFYDSDDFEALPLGLAQPKRILLITDFPQDASADDSNGIIKNPYSYNGSNTSVYSDFNSSGVDNWADRIKHKDTNSDFWTLKFEFSPGDSVVTQSQIILFDSALNLKKFYTDEDTSDVFDYLAVSFTLQTGWKFLSSCNIAIDFDDGTFAVAGDWAEWQLNREELNRNEWGGHDGGRYNIKIPKYIFNGLKNTQAGASEFLIDWTAVKAIRLGVTIREPDIGETSHTVVAFFDYLRMVESGPMISSMAKIISGFENHELWKKGTALLPDTGFFTRTYQQDFVSSGLCALDFKMTKGVFSAYLDVGDTNQGIDLSTWGQGLSAVSGAAVISFDLYCDMDKRGSTDNIGNTIISIRFTSRNGDWIGWSKWTKSKGKVGNVNPYHLDLINEGFTTIEIPVGQIVDMTPLQQWLYSLYTPLTGNVNPIFGGWDYSGVAEDPKAVLGDVTRIDLGLSFEHSDDEDGDLYIDNLRLKNRALVKPVATFSEYNFPFGQFLGGLRSMLVDWTKEADEKKEYGWKILFQIGNIATSVAHFLFEYIVAPYAKMTVQEDEDGMKEVIAGESWDFWGGPESVDTNDYYVVFSTDRSVTAGGQSLKIKVKHKATVHVGMDYTDPLLFGTTRNFTEYGNDDDTHARPFFYTGEGAVVEYDGVGIDDSDIFSFYLWRDDYNNKMKFADFKVVFGVGDGVQDDRYVYALTADQLEPPLKKWSLIKMRRSDFTRYGNDDTVGWSEVRNVQFEITNAGDTAFCYLDSFNITSAGAMTGKYRYKIIFRTKDTQSAPSLASAPLWVQDADISLSSIPVSPDPRVTYKDLYRMGGNSAEYRFVDSIANEDTEYVDTKTDEQLLEVLDENFEQPPVAKYLATDNNAMFFLNNPNFPSSLYWSRPLRGAAVPTQNRLDIEPSVAGQGTGIAVIDNSKVVFKHNAIYRIMSTKSAYRYENINKKIGCDSPRTITEFNNVVYWVWDKKPYRLVGSQIDEQFHVPVENLFAYADETACAAYHNDRILFGVKGSATSTENDTIVSFNIKYDCWEAVHFGEGWSSNALVRTFDGRLYSGASDETSNDFYIWELFTGNDDDGAPIAAKVTTAMMHGFEKRVEAADAWVVTRKAGANDTMGVTPVIDWVEKTTDIFDLTTGGVPQTSVINGLDSLIGSFFGLSLESSVSSGAWELITIVLSAKADTDAINYDESIINAE